MAGCCPISPPPPSTPCAPRCTAPATPPTASGPCSAAAAHAALGRGEPEPASRASRDGGELGVLVRLLLLGAVEPDAGGRRRAGPADAGRRRGGRAARAATATAGRPRSTCAPTAGRRTRDWWVLSDLDARRQERDHVTGVGAASLTLAAATVRRPVGSLLDLGTGCGVQALHASRHAARVTGTDVAPRALAHGPGHLRAQRRSTSSCSTGRGWSRWPGAGSTRSCPTRRSCPARRGSTTSTATPGRAGDAALAALLPTLPAHLEPGGVAQLLGSWLHVRGEDWPDRVRSWLPAGVDAWICSARSPTRRCTSAPGSATPGSTRPSPAAREQAGAWLDWMDARAGRGRRVRVPHAAPHRRRRRRWSFEDLPGELDDPLGPEIAGWLDRVDWLRAHAGDDGLLAARLRWRRRCCWSATPEPGAEGWSRGRRRGGPAGTARGGGTRSTTPPPRCWPAAAARCRWASCVELLAFAHDRPAGRAGRGHPARGARAGPARPAGARPAVAPAHDEGGRRAG